MKRSIPVLGLAFLLTASACASDSHDDVSRMADAGDGAVSADALETDVGVDVTDASPGDEAASPDVESPACGGAPALGAESVVVQFDQPSSWISTLFGRWALISDGVSIGWMPSSGSEVLWEPLPHNGGLVRGATFVSGDGWVALSGRTVWGSASSQIMARLPFGGPVPSSQDMDSDLMWTCGATDGTYCYGSTQTANLARSSGAWDAPVEDITPYDHGREVTDIGVYGGTIYSLEANWEPGVRHSELWETRLDGSRRMLLIPTSPTCWYSCDLLAGQRGVAWGATESVTEGMTWMPSPAAPGTVVPLVGPADPDFPAYAMDDSHVYWQSDGHLRRRELCLPLAPEEIVSTTGVRDAAVDDTGVYWIAADGLSVHWRPKVPPGP